MVRECNGSSNRRLWYGATARAATSTGGVTWISCPKTKQTAGRVPRLARLHAIVRASFDARQRSLSKSDPLPPPPPSPSSLSFLLRLLSIRSLLIFPRQNIKDDFFLIAQLLLRSYYEIPPLLLNYNPFRTILDWPPCFFFWSLMFFLSSQNETEKEKEKK